MKKILFCAIFILIASLSRAQYVGEFSQNDSLYIQELTSLFGTSLMEEEELAFNDFVITWDSIDVSYKQDIMLISELMRERSCRPRPQYIMFLKILLEFHKEDKINLGYDDFVKGYKLFMENEGTLIKDINNVNQSIYLLLDKSEMYSTVSLTWRLRIPDYSFVYDDHLKITTIANDIVGFSSGDSIVLQNVTGYIDPVLQQFIGTSARVTWERAGLDRNEVYADLSNFKLEFKRSEYQADSAIFYHNQLLGNPAPGVFRDKITQIKTPELAQYPSFSTYQSTYELNNIFEGVNYSGAIGMRGANLAGTGSDGLEAKIEISYNDTIRIRMFAPLFLFGSNTLRANNAEVSIYIEQDSIYHPDLIVVYHKETELLRITRSKDYNSQGPYSDSYHRLDMSFDELNWVRKEPTIHMRAALGSSVGNGLFESYDFFNMQFFESLQGMDYQHPLADLWTFSNMLGGNTFSVIAFADYLGKAPYIIRHMLMEQSKLGFVYFDFDADLVTLNPKLFDYIDASLMKRDYDVIRFFSKTGTGGENASLDLTTKDLTIYGIPNIFLSDSQNVKLVPTNNSIIMKRNRDFQFDGIIDAGLFKFYGKNFFFEYDNFLINLQNIDSLSISAKTGERDSYGNPKITTLDNKIENITGELLIDVPFNKSGLTPFPEYPIFTSRKNSYIYFDEQSIQHGVYDKNRFYFELFPFSIDSLDNFRRESMKMEGTFVSADILPPMEMKMSLRPDNSLGFYMRTPEDGISIFGGKATFFNDLEMSSAGLHGYGSLEYLTSTTWSDDFLFHPDSIMTISRRFLEKESSSGVTYPYVENEVAQVRYYPFKDRMNINRVESTFKIYNDSVHFGGDLALQPAGLTGKGRLGFPDARFESELFRFSDQQVFADSAGAKLKKAETDDYTLMTDDIKIDIDLQSREGDFVSRDDYTLIEFPANLYEARLNQVNWFMDRNEVLLTQTKILPENDVDIGIDSLKTNAPSYVSKHPQQDSLNFVSPLASFNYSSKVLNAEKVPFLEIGDSYIFPKEGKVQIMEKATLKPLREAKLMANKDSRFHLLHHANLVVDSRLHYRGAADYDYIDEFGKVFTFRMTQVEVDTSINSFGVGEIALADSFRLSPFYEYQGQVNMRAYDSLLTFAGGVRLTHDCDVKKYWLKFDSEIDPDSIMIPVAAKMQNLELNNIYAGTLKARDSIHIYPTFLSGRKDYFDKNLSYSDGYLYYDKAESTYEIASEKKLKDMSSEGNYLALRTDSCELYTEGKINLQLNYGRVKMKTVGNASHAIPENSLDLNLLLGLDFFFSPVALNILGGELDSLPNLTPVDLTSDFYKLGIRNLIGELDADKLETELGLYGNYTVIPDSMNFSIFFNDMPLSWSQETRSFRHNGKVGIGAIGDVQVNKYVDAYVEFVERGSGDIFDIYLMIDENNWLYIAYSPGGLQVLSSNPEFNSTVLNTPEKERRLKTSGRLPSYIYSLASTRRLDLFLDGFSLVEQEKSE